MACARRSPRRSPSARRALEAAALEARLATERLDLTLPAPERAARLGPPGQPGDGRAGRDLRRPRLRGRRPGRRSRTTGTISPRSTCPRATRRGRCTTRSTSERDRRLPTAPSRMLLRTHTTPVQIRTMIEPGRAAADHRAGPGLPLRQRRHPHADVPPGRRAGDRPRHPPRPPQVDARDVPQGVLRARRHRAAAAPELFPVHRAVGRGRRRLRDGKGPPRASAAMPGQAGWSCSAPAWSTPG